MPSRRTFVVGTALSAFGAAAARPSRAQKLPDSSIWTAYDLGSSGDVEASAIADALQKHHQMRVRIMPSGTSIGRLLPLKQGRANYGYLANELYFSTEGIEDFAAPSWGPQDVRVVLARPATNGLAMARDTGMTTMKDLKGKRIGYVKGNPSVNVKNEAYLAFAGLTEKDIQVVWFGSYNAMKTAIVNNQLDGMSSVTTSANMREIEASPRGLIWPAFPAADKEAWARMQKILDFLEPRREMVGAASPPEGVELIGIRYPMITNYATTSNDEVYALVKAIDEAMDTIKGTTGSSADWAPKVSGLPRADAPFHDGTIRYMKEKGWWTPEADKWQTARVARLKKVIAGWKDAEAKFKASAPDKGDAAWTAFWTEYRARNLSVAS
jgi:TRAP transporter TAXI family solute receptor